MTLSAVDQTGPITGLLWTRDAETELLHSVARIDLYRATEARRREVECLCGHTLPLTSTVQDEPSGVMCMPCLVGATADMPDPGRTGTAL